MGTRPAGLLVARNRALKRVVDYLLGVPALLVSLPIVAFFALWLRTLGHGPAFYSQEREGIGGIRIRVWKLRTMYSDAEETLERYLAENPEAHAEWRSFYKLRNDPRVLPGLGRFLRRTSLDELPQLWNVLRGDMSLVGPRPFPDYHLERFPPEFRALRQCVLPGITGLWQVTTRSEGGLEVQETLDTRYVRGWSLWLDLSILLRTIPCVISRRGAR